jgi:hypothetical protein
MGHCGGEEEWVNGFDRENISERQVGRPRHRWEDISKIGVGDIEWNGVSWRYLIQE